MTQVPGPPNDAPPQDDVPGTTSSRKSGPGGTLYVVATPLGNPEDLSPRAARTLVEADLVVAEDTRTARRLLADVQGHAPVISCFDANEDTRAWEVAEQLRAGKRVALVSEAGTPAISDPGYRIVRAAIEAGAPVVPVPGPAAVMTALVGSGLPTDHFVFAGFPPRKGGARRRLFEQLAALPWTAVLYESPLRTGATLADLAEALGAGRRACVARELTKTHEEFVRGTLGELAARYAEQRPLGEVTIVVDGAPERDDAPLAEGEILERARLLLGAGHSRRDVADELAAVTGRPRRDIYRLLLQEPDLPVRDE